MEKFEFEQPEYLFCEIPIKDGSENDHRMWVYHRLSLSLIEFINVDYYIDFQFEGIQDRFTLENRYQDGYQNWFGVFVQNNCEITNNNPNQVLKDAWLFLEKFLKWESETYDEL